jgi:predicted RNase H-like nuclease
VEMPDSGLVLGVDIGYSPTRRSSGVAVLDWSKDEVELRVKNVRESEVADAAREFVPSGREIACAALDGPIRGALDRIEVYRPAEKILTRALHRLIGKPGQTNAPVGQALNAAANRIGVRLCNEFKLAKARHQAQIHELALVEAFPTHFLGVLLAQEQIPGAVRRTRSDLYYLNLAHPTSESTSRLADLLGRLLPGRVLLGDFGAIRNHDQRAAVVCALTALCVAAGQYLAVGQSQTGFIILPPLESADGFGARVARSMKLGFTPSAWEDYLWLQVHDRNLLKRVNLLIKDTLRTSRASHPPRAAT